MALTTSGIFELVERRVAHNGDREALAFDERGTGKVLKRNLRERLEP
jgi:hypothetical protein